MTSTVDTRSMPADLEAERAILGAVLLAPSSIDEIARIVVSEVFSSDANRIIFETMLVLHRNGSPIELTTLRSELADRDALELAGGAAYISSLIDGLPSAVNVQHYADIIKSKARLRTIANAANAVLSSAMNGVKDLDDRLAQLAVSAWAETEHSAEFERLEEGRYRLTESRFGIGIEADHLRRERGQLYGEVTTKCAIGGGSDYRRWHFVEWQCEPLEPAGPRHSRQVPRGACPDRDRTRLDWAARGVLSSCPNGRASR